MIDIQARRAGLIVVVATVNGNLDITQAWGFTERGARQRLFRVLDKR